MLPEMAFLLVPALDAAAAGRFAELALTCVHREYPNKIAHVLNSDADARPPRELTPAFFGCFDWHSSVHGHWLLARLARLFPDAEFAPRARAALAQSLTAENLRREAEYLNAPGRATFERPYGLAWLLTLAQELRETDSPHAAAIRPLEDAAVARFSSWLPKLSHPVRGGEHSQTAFALGLALDYARASANSSFEQLLLERAKRYYLNDTACPAHYEPSGEDFLSPCLAEADLMRRVLPQGQFTAWLGKFLPSLPFAPLTVTDAADGKLAHLDGLNLSRAWMLNGIASALPASHPRSAVLARLAEAHGAAGLKAVTGEHYEGGHWLGSFAVYYVSGRGLTR
jgi:hypothetical protein